VRFRPISSVPTAAIARSLFPPADALRRAIASATRGSRRSARGARSDSSKEEAPRMEGATAKTSTAPEQTQTAALTNRQNSRPLPIEGSKLLLSAEPGSARQSLLLWHKVRFCSATGLRLGASRALLRAERREAHFPRYGAAPVAAAVAPRPRETDLRLVHSSRWRRAAPCCFRVRAPVRQTPLLAKSELADTGDRSKQ
jgi:hypothetical protein